MNSFIASSPMPHSLPPPVTRRQMLRQCCVGFGELALGALLAQVASAAAGPATGSGHARASHAPMFRPRARRVIFLFMHGGPSHVDTFDYKPALIRDSGKPLPFEKPRV